MKIASWNINSVRIRLEHIAKVTKEQGYDVLCLQETKVVDELFPLQPLQEMGFKHIAINGQKAYNGVAILSKIPFIKEEKYDYCSKDDKRHVKVEFANGLHLQNFYVPAGGDIADPEENPKFAHKLAFLDEMIERFSPAEKYQKTIILGDFNIAPYEHDVWSHKQLLDVVSHTPIEVERLMKLYKTQNWIDTHRKFTPLAEKLYSWWSYRSKDWKLSNRGRRLDHIWITPDLEENLTKAHIYPDARDFKSPSDHVPISIDLDI
jgi:exodeoxyribonuclease III